MIDLYNNLIDDNGKLKHEYSLEPDDNDSHINMTAFSVLEKEFMSKIQKLKK
jgi:hypothetical protein